MTNLKNYQGGFSWGRKHWIRWIAQALTGKRKRDVTVDHKLEAKKLEVKREEKGKFETRKRKEMGKAW